MTPSPDKEAGRMLPGKTPDALETFFPLLLSAVLLVPSMVWMLLDTSAWGGDQSQYGFATLELFHTLTNAPQEWPARMLDVFTYKPNGLIWLGQVFVPLAFFISSIDIALLFTTIALQAVTLILVYRSVRALSPDKWVVPATACLVVASAPLFIQFSHYYLVENLQTTSVAWFVLIMSLAPTWNRSLLLAQLTAATAVALAAKEIQPLFCVWPGAVACVYLLRSSRPEVSRAHLRLTVVSWMLAIAMAVLTAAWYFHNRAAVYQHFLDGAYGEAVRTLWGKEDTYLNTLSFWTQTARAIYFVPGIGEASLLLALGAAVLYATQAKRAPLHVSLCAAAAALQIVTVLMVFSLSPTRQLRYLLPALPYIAVVIGWALVQINRRPVMALGFCAFAAQFVLLHGQALNVLPVTSPWVVRLERPASSGRLLDSIVARTCVSSGSGPIWNIIAIDPSVPEIRGDWLAPDPANYVAAKRRFRDGGALSCHYGYFGDGFFGAEVSRAWESMLSRDTQFVVVVDPAKYTTPPQVYNQALSRENFPIVLRRLQTSELFRLEPPVDDHSGILIFRRVAGVPSPADRITWGRALTDQGFHDKAVAVLREVADVEPTNAEAWANLAFAYERAGRFQEATAAGLRARQLSPRHYYVNLLLARVSVQLEQWRDAVRYARDAAADAPSAAARVDALTLAAKAAFRSGDTPAACGFLQQAGLEAEAGRIGEVAGNPCDK